MERVVLAVDLGGTQVRAALVNGDGQISARTSTSTQAEEGAPE
jgi:predicted NBD/HSP70 family sugar kinase